MGQKEKGQGELVGPFFPVTVRAPVGVLQKRAKWRVSNGEAAKQRIEAHQSALSVAGRAGIQRRTKMISSFSWDRGRGRQQMTIVGIDRDWSEDKAGALQCAHMHAGAAALAAAAARGEAAATIVPRPRLTCAASPGALTKKSMSSWCPPERDGSSARNWGREKDSAASNRGTSTKAVP